MTGAAHTPGQSLTFKALGQDWTLEFDFAAIERYEELTDSSIIEVIAAIGGQRPRIGRMARLLQAGLTRHHPAITGEQAFELLGEAGVQDQLFAALDKALPDGNSGEEGAGAGEA